jgi:hypothetical protein
VVVPDVVDEGSTYVAQHPPRYNALIRSITGMPIAVKIPQKKIDVDHDKRYKKD